MKEITVCMLETPPKDGMPLFIYTNTGRQILFKTWKDWLDKGDEFLNGEEAVGWWPARPASKVSPFPPMCLGR